MQGKPSLNSWPLSLRGTGIIGMCHHIQYTIVKDLKNRGTASKTTCVPYSMKLRIQFYHQFKNGNSVWSFLTHGPSVHQNWGLGEGGNHCEFLLPIKSLSERNEGFGTKWQSTMAESDLPHFSRLHKFSFDFNKTAQIQNQNGTILQKWGIGSFKVPSVEAIK